MTRRLLAGYLAITVFVVMTLAIPLGVVFAGREEDRLRTEVERDARVVAAAVEDIFERGELIANPELERIAGDYVRQTGGRVVMVDEAGRSVADSASPGAEPRDFSTRPEIGSALGGTFATGSRESATLNAPLFFAAVPIVHEGRVIGAIRVSYPSTEVADRSRSVWLRLAGLSGIALLFTTVVGWLVATTMGRPVRALGEAADELAAGKLGARVSDDVGPPEIRRVARSFNTMGDRLQGLVEGQRAFLADASHQLRTPLTALRLRLETISADPDGPGTSEPEQLTHAIEAAEAEVDRLSALVDGLLEMARIDARPTLLATVNAATVVAERVSMWSPLAEEGKVRLSGDAPSLEVRVVEHGLEQILDNLIANALEVAPEGTTVRVSARGSRGAGGAHLGANQVVFSVTDGGPGLSEAEADRAFERFWRAPGAPAGGSGLGLAIVERLARISGGSAHIERPPEGGLRVVVSLPEAPGG